MNKRNVLAFLVAVLFSGLLSAQNDGEQNILQLENEVHRLVNAHRKSIGLGELVPNSYIRKEAYQHSLNMAEGKVPFSHKGFEERFERLSGFLDITSGAENVANGYNSAQDIVDGWLLSPGHKKNIEGDFNLTGIGIAKAPNGTYFYTQIFVKSQERPKIVASDFESELLGLINEHRKGLGLSALKSNDIVKAEAVNYSRQMASGRAPIGPPGYDNPMKALLSKMNAVAMTEIIAYNYYTAKEVFNSWMASTKQRETIEGSFDLTGIGVVQSADGKVFVTQVFLLSR